MYQIETKFRCKFFGYVELGLSLSEIPVNQRHKILKIAIAKLCKTKIENNDEIEIPTAKDHFKGSSDPTILFLKSMSERDGSDRKRF